MFLIADLAEFTVAEQDEVLLALLRDDTGFDPDRWAARLFRPLAVPRPKLVRAVRDVAPQYSEQDMMRMREASRQPYWGNLYF